MAELAALSARLPSFSQLANCTWSWHFIKDQFIGVESDAMLEENAGWLIPWLEPAQRMYGGMGLACDHQDADCLVSSFATAQLHNGDRGMVAVGPLTDAVFKLWTTRVSCLILLVSTSAQLKWWLRMRAVKARSHQTMKQVTKEKDEAQELKKKIASEEPVEETTPEKETSKAYHWLCVLRICICQASLFLFLFMSFCLSWGCCFKLLLSREDAVPSGAVAWQIVRVPSRSELRNLAEIPGNAAAIFDACLHQSITHWVAIEVS